MRISSIITLTMEKVPVNVKLILVTLTDCQEPTDQSQYYTSVYFIPSTLTQ